MRAISGVLLILSGLSIAAGLTQAYIEGAGTGTFFVWRPIIYGCIAGAVFLVYGMALDSGADTVQERNIKARSQEIDRLLLARTTEREEEHRRREVERMKTPPASWPTPTASPRSS